MFSQTVQQLILNINSINLGIIPTINVVEVLEENRMETNGKTR